VVIGADIGGPPEVKVYDGRTMALKLDFLAYSPAFTGGVRVAVGDVDGDGVPDIITAPGPGGGTLIKVFNGKDGSLLLAFNAYDAALSTGLYVAAGDLNGDAVADIITAPDAGGGPLVHAFNGKDLSLLYSFNAYAPSFRGGVRVAAGDVDGDGRADIITAPGFGGGPLVKAFSGATGTLLISFNAYDPAFIGGVYVSASDLNGDGKAEIITGPGVGGGALVVAFDGTDGSMVRMLNGVTTLATGGVRVAGLQDLNGNGKEEIVTGANPSGQAPNGGGGITAQVYDGATLAILDNLFLFDPFSVGSYFIAGSR
jgi:hypothetical protein